MRRGLMIAFLASVLLGAAAVQAQDELYQQLPDEAYTTNYFGTTLVVTMPEPLQTDPGDWWGNALPDELFYEQSSLYEAINERRLDSGTPALDPYGWYIEIGDEVATEGTEEEPGEWQYEIHFFEMRPAEVMLILDELGGAESLFPGSQLSFLPCLQRSFSASAGELDESFVLILAEQEYSFDPRLTVDALYDELALAFLDAYGQEVIFDLYVYSYLLQDGSMGLELDAYAQLPAG